MPLPYHDFKITKGKVQIMIISRAPFRVSFCGGGSDIPSFYEKYTGCVLSTTIRKYVYLTINKAFNKDSITLKYSETEVVNDPSQIKHRIFRQVLTDFKTKGVEITSMADIPAGTGYSIKFKLDTGFYGVIAEINDAAGSFTFGYDGGFWYTVGGVKTPIDMSSWFSTASMFQPASASQSNKIFVFNTNETIDFTDSNTVIRFSDAAVKYWWYLKYYNNQISVVRGEEVNGA